MGSGALQPLHSTPEVFRRQQCSDVMEMNNCDTDQLLALHVALPPHSLDKDTGTCPSSQRARTEGSLEWGRVGDLLRRESFLVRGGDGEEESQSPELWH